MATRMSPISGPSGYVLVPLREGADSTLYRGRQHGNPSSVLAIALSAEQPSPQSLQRLEHEYSLAAELDPAWAAKPLALTRHEGRTILLLTDPGGEPLDHVLERDHGQPLDLTRFLCIAIGLAAALGQVHRVASPQLSFDLRLTGAGQVMYAKDKLGIQGFIQEGAREDRSYYYSLPRLQIVGPDHLRWKRRPPARDRRPSAYGLFS